MSELSDTMNQAVYKCLRRVGEDFARTVRDDEITLLVNPMTFARLFTDPDTGPHFGWVGDGPTGYRIWKSLKIRQSLQVQEGALRVDFTATWTESL